MYQRVPKTHITPTFSPAFLSDSRQQLQSSFQNSECQGCSHYEEDIAILQQKLMETHNKLIEQIDICREKELQIVTLKEDINQINKKDNKRKKNSIQNRNEEKSPGKITSALKIYDQQQYQHSIEPLIETKNQLLKNDLQAMRSKVLSEITKSNKLKQQLAIKESSHQQQINEYRDRIKKLEINCKKFVADNQLLQEKLKIMEENHNKIRGECLCGFEQKYYQLDQAFMNQRAITNQLIDENNLMQNKIHELKIKNIQNAKDNQYLDNHSKITQQKTIRKENRVKDTGRYKQKRKADFQQTKNLINKLQEAQRSVRYKK